jgi:hypothetical protein
MTTKKTDRAEWKRRVLEWLRSNERAAVYAKREGISPRSLVWWRWRLEKDGELATSTALVPFLDVTTVSDQAPAPIEIALGNGRVVRVPAAFDDAALARVLVIADGAAA